MDEVPIKNAAASDIPPGGVVRGYAIDPVSGAVLVSAPTAAGQGALLVNGRFVVPVGGIGAATLENRVEAAYDPQDGVPAAGDTWGGVVGSFLLRKDVAGFVILTPGELGVVNAVRYPQVTPGAGGPFWATLTAYNVGTGRWDWAAVYGVATGTNNAVPVTLEDGNYANPVVGLRVLMLPPEAGYYHFLPIGYADYSGGTYYPGLVSIGAQTFKGVKTFVSDVEIFDSTASGFPGSVRIGGNYSGGGTDTPFIQFRGHVSGNSPTVTIIGAVGLLTVAADSGVRIASNGQSASGGTNGVVVSVPAAQNIILESVQAAIGDGICGRTYFRVGLGVAPASVGGIGVVEANVGIGDVFTPSPTGSLKPGAQIRGGVPVSLGTAPIPAGTYNTPGTYP